MHYWYLYRALFYSNWVSKDTRRIERNELMKEFLTARLNVFIKNRPASRARPKEGPACRSVLIGTDRLPDLSIVTAGLTVYRQVILSLSINFTRAVKAMYKSSVDHVQVDLMPAL
jgi:hypothetical protein